MVKIALIYGGVSGAIIITSMILGITLSGGEGAGSSLWFGYLVMLIALTLIFIGVKNYRDKDLGGVIKFSQAFLAGLGVAAIAGLVYVGVWEVYLAQTEYAFIDQYTAGIVESEKAKGLSGDDLADVVEKMQKLKQQYANPFFRLPMTFLELFPVGFVVALVSALLLRNENFMAARR